MANRTYLFATDLVPSIANSGAPRKLVGLSECNYEIPLTYALLVAGSPELCLSNIWQYRTEAGAPSHPLALAAPYAQGLQRARDFYALLTQPTARSVFHEALSFLEREENQQPYLLLELGEYLSMFDEADPPEGKLHVKARAFHAMLQGDPSDSIRQVASELNALPADDPVAAKQKTMEQLGPCVWSNVLYHAPSDRGV
jgi:hypothetical protein